MRGPQLAVLNPNTTPVDFCCVEFYRILCRNRQDFGYRAWFGDLGPQLGRERLNVIVPSLKTRFGAPEPLVIWAQLHAAGSNLAVCLRAGPKLLGTVA